MCLVRVQSQAGNLPVWPSYYLLMMICSPSLLLDIIALLIIGVILVGIFLVWENHLEKALDIPNKPKSIWTPPPLMKLSLWARAKGRMAVILAIAFLNWSGFLCWTFWVQVCPVGYFLDVAGTHHVPVSSITRITWASALSIPWSDSYPCSSWVVCVTFSSPWSFQGSLS